AGIEIMTRHSSCSLSRGEGFSGGGGFSWEKSSHATSVLPTRGSSRSTLFFAAIQSPKKTLLRNHPTRLPTLFATLTCVAEGGLAFLLVSNGGFCRKMIAHAISFATVTSRNQAPSKTACSSKKTRIRYSKGSLSVVTPCEPVWPLSICVASFFWGHSGC